MQEQKSNHAQKANTNVLYIVIFFAILGSALFMRLCNLGEFGFWFDEMLHVNPAKSIVMGEGPVDPTGREYTRALVFTKIVAFFFDVFDESEAVARMPAVLFNLLFLLISFYFVWKISSIEAALLYLFCLAFSPEILEIARQCRMYTAFQLFYFLGAITFFYGFEKCEAPLRAKLHLRPLSFEKQHDINLFLIAISIIFFLLSFHFQKLTVTFVLVVVGYTMAMMLQLWYEKGIGDFKTRKYAILFIAIISLFVLMYAVNSEFVESQWKYMVSKLGWAENLMYPKTYYLDMLLENYPVLLCLYPFGVLYLYYRDKKLAIFLFCIFITLFLFHSFVIQMKSDRYFMHAFPFFFIGIMPLLGRLTITIFSGIGKFANSKTFTMKSLCWVTFTLMLSSLFYPSVSNSLELLESSPRADWKRFSEKMKDEIDPTVPIIGTDLWTTLHYIGRLDYKLRLTPAHRNKNLITYRNQTYVHSANELKEVIKKHEQLYVIMRFSQLHNPFRVNNAVKRVLAEYFEKKHFREYKIVFYRKKPDV